MLDHSVAKPLVDEGTGESLFESSTPIPLDSLASLGQHAEPVSSKSVEPARHGAAKCSYP
jgi:hypothetical protein